MSDSDYLLYLENSLKNCIEQEDYIKASKIADEIKKLKGNG